MINRSNNASPCYRLGIDLGGTKIELIVLKDAQEIFRQRIATPQLYQDIVCSVGALVQEACSACCMDEGSWTVGIGMPGALTDKGRVKNANTVCLNGQPFVRDIETQLGVRVNVMNDANCFALSESVDGAGANKKVVFGVIIGTGVGGGIVIDQLPLHGANAIGGEWGHIPISERAPVSSLQKRPCYCGQFNCVETFLSGQGLLQTYHEIFLAHRDSAKALEKGFDVKALVALSQTGDAVALKALSLYVEQLAANLASVINIVDPDVIVLGGGLSNIPALAEDVFAVLGRYVFSDSVKTQVLKNSHGDSSGVRGAAWL